MSAAVRTVDGTPGTLVDEFARLDLNTFSACSAAISCAGAIENFVFCPTIFGLFCKLSNSTSFAKTLKIFFSLNITRLRVSSESGRAVSSAFLALLTIF